MTLMVARRTDIDDIDLARLAAQGDEWAQRRLAKQLFNRIRATVYYLAGGHRDVDDFFQLSMIEIIKSARTFRGLSSIESWAQKIAARTTIRQLKQSRHRDNTMMTPLSDREIDAATTDDSFSKHQIRARLYELLGALKPKHREVIVLHLVLGYSVPEISEVTRARFETVRYRLKVGRKQLRRLLGDDAMFEEWTGEGGDNND